VAISQNVNIRRCQFASISTIDISQHVTEQQSARDFYDVTLHAPLGLGMNLSVSMSGRVVVASLIRLSNGQHSPAQLCGLIAPLDVMIGINGTNIEQMDLQQTTEVLKTLERLGKVLLQRNMSVVESIIDMHITGECSSSLPVW
jgi:C-terminal processing protease CtpA/Prc